MYLGSIKTKVDIPEGLMKEAMKLAGAKTKHEALLTAVERFNHLKRLERLNARVRGQFRDFMTPADLKALRAADMPKAR